MSLVKKGFKLIYNVQFVVVATNLRLLFGFLCHCGGVITPTNAFTHG